MATHNFKITIPAILEYTITAPLLLGRRIKYGYTFRRIPLSRGKYAIVDARDYESLSRYKWYLHVSMGTCYAVRNVKRNGKMGHLWMHRVIMNAPEELVVDHINHNGLDNRRVNLRLATHKQNKWNSRKGKTRGKSRYKGVGWDRRSRKWRAVLCVNGKKQSLGYYEDEIEAAKACDRAARKYKGEFAVLNFPIPLPVRGPEDNHRGG
jgi:hypothetical protein